jgi:hypothetical protein
MRVINVIEINDYENNNIKVHSFPIVEEQLSGEVVEKAQEFFSECIAENSSDQDIQNNTDEGDRVVQAAVDDGYWEEGTYKVLLIWSETK